MDGRDDDVRAEGGGWEDAFREAPQEAAALSVEAVISTHRLGKDSDALEGLGRGGHDGEARWLLLQKEEILRCAEEEEARWRKEEEVRRREEEATERYRLQKEGRAVPDWFYAERIEADARNRQGGGASGGGGWRRGVFLRTGAAANVSLIEV